MGAFGLIQMEKLTHDQTWLHGDSIWENAEIVGIISSIESAHDMRPSVKRLEYDLKYNAFMFRQRMFMKPEPFPKADNLNDMSDYLKRHWNSIHGAAESDSYLKDYLLWK